MDRRLSSVVDDALYTSHRKGDRTLVVGEQPELVHPGDRRSAGGDAEFPVDRDRLCLHSVPCDVELLADLAEGEMGGQ